jgi:hypothetical protein
MSDFEKNAATIGEIDAAREFGFCLAKVAWSH